MCRNIRVLYNLDPPTTDEEIHAAATQYVRKVSGGRSTPSAANAAAFAAAVEAVATATRELLDSLVTSAPPRDRETLAAAARARAARRYEPSAPADEPGTPDPETTGEGPAGS